MKSLALVAAPLVLAACAAAPPARQAATPSAPSPAATDAVAIAAAAKTDVPEKPAAAEAKLLARIEQLTGEPELIQRLGGPTRPQITPRSFNLSDLPATHVGDPFTPSDPPLGLLGKSEPAAEVVLTPLGGQSGSQRANTVAWKDPTFGEIMVGDWQIKNRSFNRTSGNPSYVSCGTVYPRYQPARWISLRRAEEGRVELTVSDGWLDAADCKLWVERRVSVKAPSLLPGDLLYAFRDCKGAENGKPACAGEEALTLILPSSQSLVANGVGGEAHGQNSTFAMVTIPIRKGGGGSLFARLDSFGQNIWTVGFLQPGAPKVAAGLTALDSGPVGLGVEVSQGVDDPEPIAIAYVARPPALPDAISGL